MKKSLYKMIKSGEIKIINMDNKTKRKSKSGKIIVDTKALNLYLKRKRDLETKYFPKIKITFP